MKNLWNYSELAELRKHAGCYHFFQLLMAANLVRLYSSNIEIPSDVEIQMLDRI